MAQRVNWEMVRLGDVVVVDRGVSYSGKFLTDDGLPMINLKCIERGGGFRAEGTKPYSGPHKDRHVVGPGDVVIANTDLTQAGSIIGCPAVIPPGFPANSLISHHLFAVRFPQKSRIDPRFLYDRLRAQSFLGYAKGVASGTTVLGLRREDLLNFQFLLPPMSTQRAIASVLSAFDELIANNNRRIEILEEIARAIYRQWFVEFRYPGHEGASLVESELGPIPEGWAVASLGDVAKVNARSIKRGQEPETIAYVDISSVLTGRVESMTTMPFSEAPSRARRLVSPGDTIWSTVRPNRRSYAFLSAPHPDMVVSTGFAVLTPVSVPPAWLHLATTTDQFAGYLSNRATGVAYPAVTGSVFKEAPILIPPATVVGDFEGLAGPMLESIDAKVEINGTLREIRDLLLPKLLSGEIDISELIIDSAA